MDLFILDSLFRRTEIVDRYKSLIWTERWAGWGDFELLIRSTRENRRLLTKGTFLSINVSHRVMRVETTEDAIDQSGVRMIKVKGRSFETILEDRCLMFDNVYYYTPLDLMTYLVKRVCVDGYESTLDIIPNLVVARHPSLPADTITPSADILQQELGPGALYPIIEKLGTTWNLGFRMLLNNDNGQLYFDVYSGVDRTATQTVYDSVLFTPELDNLQNTTELSTIEGTKNVAYVYSRAEGQLPVAVEVWAEDVDPESVGFDRQIVLVDASDETSDVATDDEKWDIMRRMGKEALAEHRPLMAFDGEIRQDSGYVYNRDYYLGDLVEVRSEDGVANQMRVTEQIFVSDSEGDKSYPTLSLNTFVNVGSWLSWPPDKRWIDYDTDLDTVWSSLP